MNIGGTAHERNRIMNTTLRPIALAMCTLVFMFVGVYANDAMAVSVDTPAVVWSTRINIGADMSAMSIDGHRVLYSDANGYTGHVIVVDVATGAISANYIINVNRHQGRDVINSMHFLNDTSFMVVTSFSLYVMDARTGKIIEDVGLPATGSGIKYVVPMYNTDKLIIGAYRSLYKYDYKTKQFDTIYQSTDGGVTGHTGNVGWIGLSDDELAVYSAGEPQIDVNGGPPRADRLCAWELATGKQLYQFDVPALVAQPMPSNGTHARFVAALGKNKAVVYDLQIGIVKALFSDVAHESQGVGVSRDGSVIGIHGDRRIDFYATKDPHLFASMNAWPAYDIRFLDDGTSDVLISKVDTSVQRVRLNLATSVNDDAAPQALQCSISPNPSCGQATLQIVLASPAVVSVRLSATDGRVVLERSLGLVQAGNFSEVLQAPSGYYLCTITTGSRTQTLPVVFR